MPALHDITVWRGDSLARPLRLKTKTAGVTAPINLNGSTFEFTAEWDGGTLHKELAITSALSGEVTLALTDSELLGLPIGSVKYKVVWRNGAEVKTIVYGQVKTIGWADGV